MEDKEYVLGFNVLMFLIIIILFFIESDLIPGLGTFIACLLLPLEVGILTGIGINLLFILYHAARPKITVEVLKVSLFSVIKHSSLVVR